MGGNHSKDGGFKFDDNEKEVMNLKEKVRLLQEEIKGMMGEREKEKRNYEREIMVFSFKEADWKQERKKLKEEVMQLRKMVAEKEMKEPERSGRSRGHGCSCIAVTATADSREEWELMGTKLLVEKMKEERARRDEAVDKWKQLYLAIKTELDDLIHRTYHGDGVYWKAEEKEIHMEDMKRELQEKEGSIRSLRTQLESMEQEKVKKEREFDLLRQSLRIMNGKKSSIQTEQKLLKCKRGR